MILILIAVRGRAGAARPDPGSGDGFAVVQVLRRVPAVLDDETRALIADRLFDRRGTGDRIVTLAHT
jgi:hypothetical protein